MHNHEIGRHVGQPFIVMDLNSGTAAEGGALAPSLSFGTVFKSAAFAKTPDRIMKIVLQDVEVTQV